MSEMVKLDVDKPVAETRVVKASELGGSSQGMAGWRPVLVYQEPETTSYQWDMSKQMNVPSDQKIVTKILFVRGDESTVLTDLRARAEEAEAQTRHYQGVVAASQKAEQAWKAKHDNLAKESEDQEKRLASALKSRREDQERLQKLERDLAKVRTAVGDLRWKEIVGS